MSPRSSLQARGGKDDLKSRRAEIVAVLSHDSCTQCARCQLHTPGHRVTGRIRIRRMQVTLGLIKPTVCAYRPNVLRALRRIQALNSIEVGQKKRKIHTDPKIVRTKSVHWNTNDAAAFYAEHQGKFYYNRLILGMTSGPSLALALSGRDAIRTWRELIGPTKAYRTAWEQPHTLRGEFGLGDTRNGFHGSGMYEVLC